MAENYMLVLYLQYNKKASLIIYFIIILQGFKAQLIFNHG